LTDVERDRNLLFSKFLQDELLEAQINKDAVTSTVSQERPVGLSVVSVERCVISF